MVSPSLSLDALMQESWYDWSPEVISSSTKGEISLLSQTNHKRYCWQRRIHVPEPQPQKQLQLS